MTRNFDRNGFRPRARRLTLELVVKQEQGLFVGLGRSDDGEHPLAAVIVGSLGDRNLGPGKSSDLGDLGSGTSAIDKHRDCVSDRCRRMSELGMSRIESVADSHDTADHVARDRDALRPQVGVDFTTSERSLSGSGQRGRGQALSTSVSTFRPPPVSTELRRGPAHPPLPVPAKGRSSTGPPDPTGRSGDGGRTETSGEDTLITSRTGLVVDGPLSPVPVPQEALSDLVNGLFDSLDVPLDLDDPFGGLRKHLLGGDHPGA